jgi:hypothetical protein
MRRITLARSRKVSGIAAAVVLSLGMLTTLAPAAPAAAATQYWPSIFLNHYTGIRVGETLKVTGEGFKPNTTVTLYQCNEGVLYAPAGVFTKKTCDLQNTPKAHVGSKGTFTATFTVKVKKIDGQVANTVSTHTRILGGLYDSWGWQNSSASKTAPFLTSTLTEPWLNPQTVKLTGLLIPRAAPGSVDYAQECNDNVLSGDTKACGKPVRVTLLSGGRAEGELSVVMGEVGDGTCGTGSADEVCYIALTNVPRKGAITPVATEAIDFYEAAATHVVTVAGGGTLSASAASTTLTDGNVSVTCSAKGSTPASTAQATIRNGTTSAKAPHPIGIAADLTFSNCSGPLGKVTITPAGEPYPVNANSATSSGATAATISEIDVNVSMTGCSFTVTGSAPGDYSNSTRTLALTPNPNPGGLTKAELSVSNVSGCAGLVKNGNHPAYTSNYKLSPATLTIKSAV